MKSQRLFSTFDLSRKIDTSPADNLSQNTTKWHFQLYISSDIILMKFSPQRWLVHLGWKDSLRIFMRDLYKRIKFLSYILFLGFYQLFVILETIFCKIFFFSLQTKRDNPISFPIYISIHFFSLIPHSIFPIFCWRMFCVFFSWYPLNYTWICFTLQFLFLRKIPILDQFSNMKITWDTKNNIYLSSFHSWAFREI